MNQVIQRIGRVVRKYEGKRKAPDICGICFILEIFRKAIEMGDRTVVTEVVEDKGVGTK
jgi:superfamily II DNA or RNA helicase